jgi:hypothetical protein
MEVIERKRAQKEMKKARDDLAERVEELERFSKIAIGRELRMVELKKKIKKLKGRLKKR